MKFGESLNESLVPEWKEQYVDYKAGKKIIKKVTQLYEEINGRKTSDVTPLLNPLDADTNYVHDVPEEDLGELAIYNHTETNARRRQSIFNLSMKSAKNKKEDYYNERANFTTWVNEELEMVNRFYVEKEKEIYERFLVLEDQFYQLKEHRLQMSKRQLEDAHHAKNPVNVNVTGWYAELRRRLLPVARYEFPSLPSATFLEKWKSKKNKLDDVRMSTNVAADEIEYYPNLRENRIRNGDLISDTDDLLIGSNQDNVLQQRPSSEQRTRMNRRDYVVKKKFDVPYFYARKQLKRALIEHYRSISLLKSYRVLNRTALRKITKKFDKAILAKISKDFMDKVDKEAYFQTSEVLDKIASRIEDLFLTFFDAEKTDKKHGLEKLRSATYAYNNADIRLPLFYKPVFGSGLFLGVGVPLLIIALVSGLEKTLDKELPEGKFLLQIWGGFFMMNLMLLLIGLNFLVFTKFKINYKFIFEFNLTTALDYKQFLLLPSFGFGILGILCFLSFQNYWPNVFPGRDFPLLYLGICLAVFLWPGAQFYPASRKWLQIALWRIMCSGLYPVEFRDFSGGDWFCSLTYSMGNLSFFFCLYARDWRGLLRGGIARSKSKCGSDNSHLMGFLAALPSIWRLLQCVRRFMDSGDAFPHLANVVKYLVGVAQYALLSMWRIDRSQGYRVLFIIVASVNSIYCSLWDIIMDWSLGQTNSKNFLLRDHLFFGNPAYYYTAIVLNVILRFQWIFYAFFSHQIQQLAVTSFAIAVAEIIRRFIWFFFRLENEHCTNVILFRASRDSPLPYMVTSKVERAIKKLVVARYDKHLSMENEFSVDAVERTGQPSVGRTTAYSGSTATKVYDEEQSIDGRSEIENRLARRKSTFTTISAALNRAHIKDFQRKKLTMQIDESDEDEDDDDDAGLIK